MEQNKVIISKQKSIISEGRSAPYGIGIVYLLKSLYLLMQTCKKSDIIQNGRPKGVIQAQKDANKRVLAAPAKHAAGLNWGLSNRV